MTDDQIADALKDAILPIMRGLKTQKHRQEAAEQLCALGYELMRGLAGNEFARGWLDAAMIDLSTSPPKVVIRELQ